MELVNTQLAADNAALRTANARLQQQLLDLEARAAQPTQAAQAATRQQAQEVFYQVLEQAPVLVCLLRGPAHRIDSHNQAYQALFPGRQLRGRPIAEVQPEATAAGFVALLDEVYRTGRPHAGTEHPLAIAQPDGQPPRTTYFDFTYQRFEENGRPVGISVFAHDVTERVLSRRQRETQQRHLHGLFEQLPVALSLLAGPDYVLDVVNPLMAALLGRPLPQLLGRPFLEAVPEMADQGFKELMDEVRRTETPYLAQERETQLVRGGRPETGFFNLVYLPLHDEQGQLTGITCVAIDVSPQVRARQQVQQLNQELAAANQGLTHANEELRRTNADLDTFIYTASHDLKHPIANIEGLVLALGEQLPASVRQEAIIDQVLALMQRDVERFRLTISQLSSIAQLRQPHPAEVVGLAALVEALRPDLARLLAAEGTQLLLDVAACPDVSFAPRHLRSIVYNLLSNALKFRAPDRPAVVHLRCRSTEVATVLEVQDNGLGLRPDQQAQLFGLFQRQHSHVEGAGIGLYMVKKIVERAGGTVAVQSQPGTGSTFTVTLPGSEAALVPAG